MPRRFLMFTTRDHDDLAWREREAILRFGGLDEDELFWVRLEREPMPQLNFTSWDGIILCGSRYDAGAPEDQKSLRQVEIESALDSLLENVISRDFPFLGICYGMGLLANHLGGTIDTNRGEVIGPADLTLTQEGSRDPILAGVPMRFEAYVGHHEGIGRPSPEMKTLIAGQDCPTQMIRVGTNVYATQFHPELDLEGILFRIDFFSDAGYYDPSDRDAIESSVRATDTSAAHQILRNFIELYGSAPGVA